MKTITLFSREFPPILLGGIGNTARFLAEELSKSKFKVNVITPKFGAYSNLPAIEKKNNITIYRLQMRERLLFWYKTAVFSHLNKKLIRSSNLIHLLNMRDAPFIYKKSPVIANVNDYYPLEAPLNFLKYPYNEKGKLGKYLNYQLFKVLDFTSLQRADFIVYNSNYTKKVVETGYRLKRKKNMVIYKGIDVNEFITNRNYKKEIDVLFAGSPLSTKGAKEFIYAVDLLKKKHENIRAVLIGRPSKLDINYAKLIKKLNLEKNIEFKGYVSHEELIEFYHKSKIFAMPSYREAFGQTLLEAMAAKIPVVASNTGGIPEVLGKAGFLVKKGEAEPLAEKIEYLLENKELRQELGIKGYERVKKHFNFKGMIQSYIKLYEEMS